VAGAEVTANALADAIESSAGGRIIVERHPPGSIVDGFSEFQGVADGDLDIAWGFIGSATDELGEAASVLGASYGLLGPWGGAYWVTDPERTRPIIDALTVGTGVVLMSGPIPVVDLFAVCTAGTTIDTVSDVQGLTVGATGHMAGIFSAMGATVTDISRDEAHGALASGSVDCAMTGPPSNAWDLGLQDVAPEWFGPAIQKQGRTGMDVMVNEAAWAALPRDLQVVTEGAIKGFAYGQTWRIWDKSVYEWQDIVASGKINMNVLPQEVQQYVRDATIFYVNGVVEGDANATTIWNTMKSFDSLWQLWYLEGMVMDYDTYIITDKLSDYEFSPASPEYIAMYRPGPPTEPVEINELHPWRAEIIRKALLDGTAYTGR